MSFSTNIATTATATATATANTASPDEKKQSFFMKCVTGIKNCCKHPETMMGAAGAAALVVGTGLIIGGVVATGGALAAVGLAIGFGSIVLSAIRLTKSESSEISSPKTSGSSELSPSEDVSPQTGDLIPPGVTTDPQTNAA